MLFGSSHGAKVSQSKMIRTIRRLGVPEKTINMIKAIYLAPNYLITEKDVTTTPRIQKTGIRQGCPLSPYLFIMLMTVIMHDVESSLTEQELDTTNRDRLHKQVNGKLLYTDDTIIMAKTAESVETILHRIELESSKYSSKLNQNKYIHIQMSAVERIHSLEGNVVPIQTQADYLGGRIKKTGDHKPELQHRITATWATLRKFDLLWGKSTASITWKIEVYDAVTVAKLMYGLASIPLTKADGGKINAFQMKGLRKILNTKSPYRSRVSNKKLLERVNVRPSGELENKELKRFSTRLIERQTVYICTHH